MKTIIKQAGWIMCAGLTIMLGAGCKTIVRENIISAIDTGIGATLAENKQTQLYELKAGYIRSQFYSIPTGKLVENKNPETQIVLDKNGNVVKAQISNAANITPQLVAGIRSHTGLQDIFLGMDVSENFAVGDVAVNSQAATAMYVAAATSDTKATAASQAVQSLSATTFSATDQNHMADVSDQYHAIKDPATKAKWDGVITNVTGKTDINDLVRTGTKVDWNNVYTVLKSRSLLQ
jgi:hypothetical protein